MRLSMLFVFIFVWQLVGPVRSGDAKFFVPAKEEPMLKWLPVDVETLVVARKPYRYKDYSGGLIDSSYYLDLRHLPGTPPIQTKSQIKNTILMNIEAARDFQFPGGNGSTVYEGCHICLFKKAHQIDLEKYSMNFLIIEGHKVAQKTVPVGFGSMETFLALPKNNLTVLTTSKRYMRIILKRMKSSPSERAMPILLKEWRGVKPDANFYAIRHYAKSSKDDMSPYSKNSIWNNYGYGRAYKAIGFSFSASSYHPSNIDFWYFSDSIKDIRTIEMIFSHGDPKSVNKTKVSDNTWNIVVDAKTPTRFRTTIIHLMALLGHTPYF